MSDEDLQAQLEKLKKENEALKKGSGSAGGLSCKVSAKGALSVYGLGRFPVTLYKQQWERLLEFGDDIRSFMEANSSELKTK